MGNRVITLPNGKACGLPRYCAAWRALRALPADARIVGFDHFPEPAERVLRALRRGLHDRINRHDPAFGKGRKWDHSWQTDALRVAIKVNDPRLAIHAPELPLEWRERFAHRLSD